MINLKLVNEISHRKRKKGCSINSMLNKEGVRLTDPQEIANCLNDHFGTVGANMAEKFNEVDNERLRDPLDYMKNEVKNSFVFSPTSTFEIHTLIDKLNNKKSSGYSH